MFLQDFDADAQQDESAQGVGMVADVGETGKAADKAAEVHARNRNDKTDRPDDKRREPYLLAKQGEREADGQGVKTGGNAEQQEVGAPRGIVLHAAFGFIPAPVIPGFLEHLEAHKGEQGKGEPMVVVFNVFLRPYAEQPAENGHDELEKSENAGHAHGVAQADTTEANAGCNAHGKGVHGKSHGNGEHGAEQHKASLDGPYSPGQKRGQALPAPRRIACAGIDDPRRERFLRPAGRTKDRRSVGRAHP